MDYFGDSASAVAALAALVTVYFAWQTVREAREATTEARLTAAEARSDRQRRDLMAIADLVEEIEQGLNRLGTDWVRQKRALTQALSGQFDLPRCEELCRAGDSNVVKACINPARLEVEAALRCLAKVAD